MWLGDLGPERRDWRDPRNGRVWVVARDPEKAPGVLKFLELGEMVEETIEARVGPGVELMRLSDERLGEILDEAL
jgi:hypothetical protein